MIPLLAAVLALLCCCCCSPGAAIASGLTASLQQQLHHHGSGAALGLSTASIADYNGVECPSICICDTWIIMQQSLLKASCAGQNLYSVNARVPYYVQVLDLSNNSIRELEDRQLSRAGLTKLRYLNLSNNSINDIRLKAFEDLTNLTALDLSRNRIDYIHPDAFYSHDHLVVLKLSGNKFNMFVPTIHSKSLKELDLSYCDITYLKRDMFQGLKQLRTLNLAGNQLNALEKDVFQNLKFLKSLDLSRNKFIKLERDVIRVLPNLSKLTLGGNQWFCEATMFDLKYYLNNRNVTYDSFCEKPGLEAAFKKFIDMNNVEDEPIITKVDEDAGSDDQSFNVARDMNAWFEMEQVIRRHQLDPVAAKQAINDHQRLNDPRYTDAWLEMEELIRQHQLDTVAAKQANQSFFSFHSVTPGWFVILGFFLGCTLTIIVTYTWLSTTVNCKVPRMRQESGETNNSADTNSQRASLLRNLYQQQENNNATSTTTAAEEVEQHSDMDSISSVRSMNSPCPGTPPPPYREVMAHRNRYPRIYLNGRFILPQMATERAHRAAVRIDSRGANASSTSN